MEYQAIEKAKGGEGVLLSHAHKAKPRTPGSNKLKGTKFVGVRQRPSGKWVAEIKDTTQKIRMWLGTFETAEEAARAYDEAALLLRGSNTRTNFANPDQYGAANSPISTKVRNLLHHKICLRRNSTGPDSSSLGNDNGNGNGNGNISIAATPAFEVNITNSSSSITTTTSTVIDKSLDSITDQDTSTIRAKNEEHDNNMTSTFTDKGYRPDLSSCIVEQERATAFGVSHHFIGSSWHSAIGWEEQAPAIATSIQQGLLSRDDIKATETTEFEPIEEEIRISASMYAMNGENDFPGNGCETGNQVDAFWDFSKLYFSPCNFFLS